MAPPERQIYTEDGVLPHGSEFFANLFQSAHQSQTIELDQNEFDMHNYCKTYAQLVVVESDAGTSYDKEEEKREEEERRERRRW